MIWVMARIHIRSTQDPLSTPDIAHLAAELIVRIEAMGLLPKDQTIEGLDLGTLRQVLDHARKAQIFRGIHIDLSDRTKLKSLLVHLNQILEESPAPSCEWPHLVELLGLDLLARLLGLSASSVRRYSSQARQTPDDVSVRLHFLALVVGDLAGAYNDIGIRRWFGRPRTALGNRAPQEAFVGSWFPGDPDPTAVRGLARSLVTAPAT